MNKVEKIKAEIDRLQYSMLDENSNFKSQYDQGIFDGLSLIDNFIDSLEEEPISNDLEEAAKNYEEDAIFYAARRISDFFKAGAQWQKEHLEMNRIKHCNNITEEQYNLEAEFLDGWIEKYDRLPTFLDAIEYGMKLQKEQDQSTIELAEDHAMLAGMEKMKEEMIDKFFKWLAKHWREYVWLTDNNVIHFGHWEYDFRRAMEE